MGTGAHRNNFDALRLGAALAVLVSHQFMFLGLPQPTVVRGLSVGMVAVMVFFAISGYLVSASWRHDPSLGRFLIRRGLRIVPGLFAVWAVMAALAAIGLDKFPMNPVAEVNGSLWTIPMEVQCYMLFAVAALVVRRGALLFVLGLLGCLLYRYSYFVAFGAFFAVGALLDQFPSLRARRALAVWLPLGAALLTLFQDPYAGLACIVAPLAIWIGTSSWPVLRSVGRYGDFSYGTYLYACIVQQLLVLWLGVGGYWLMLGLSALGTLTCAWVSWHYIEAPALGLKDCLAVRELRGRRREVAGVSADTLSQSEVVNETVDRSARRLPAIAKPDGNVEVVRGISPA